MQASQEQSANDLAIQRVLWHVLALNLTVALAKLGIGLFTGAISIVADGFHSLVDGLSNLIALLAQRIAARPPDEDHPYGHRRFESIATLMIGAFLLLVAWEVLRAAVQRLSEGSAPRVLPASFAVLLATLGINLFVVWYERRQGRRLNSRILMADASQTAVDVLITCSVIAGLLLTRAGLAWVDALMALLIVLLIGRIGWKIIMDSAGVLVDRAPLSAASVAAVVAKVPQVENVTRVRSRGADPDVHVDVEVEVPPALTADHAHNLQRSIEERIAARFPQVAEVQVAFAPHHKGVLDFPLLARAAADGLGLGVHEVVAIPTDEGITLEMHVEVQRGLSLNAAHKLVSRLESSLTNHAEIHSILTHIEPFGTSGAPLSHSQQALALRDEALAIAERLHPQAHWHEAAIRLAMGGYALLMHCALPGTMSVEEAHQISEAVETQIRADLPSIQRVTIHTEPMEG